MSLNDGRNVKAKKHCNRLFTARMCLRQITEADTKAIVELRSDPMIYRFFRAPHRLAQEEHLKWFRENYLLDDDRIDWIALLEEQPIGSFGLRRMKDTPEHIEVSYLLAPAVQGQGYAKEALDALLHWAAEEWHSKRAFAEIHEGNEASLHFISRMGFHFWKQEPPFVFYWREL